MSPYSLRTRCGCLMARELTVPSLPGLARRIVCSLSNALVNCNLESRGRRLDI